MKVKRYPLYKVHVDTKEAMREVRNVLKSGFMNEGEQCTILRRALTAYVKAHDVVLVNSGTSALTIALKAAGVERHDDVISTSMTCVATNVPIVHLGADILWADTNPQTGCIDPDDVDRILDEVDDVRAVVAVLWAGNLPDLKRLSKVCELHGTKLVLDAAQGLGATYEGRSLFEWCDFVCYSLQAIKHVTTGDGGFVVARSQQDFARLHRLKWFGIDRESTKDSSGNWRGQAWDFDVTEAGWKMNMNNLSAAVGLSQVPHINDIVKKHRHNAHLYDELFVSSKHVMPVLRHDEGSSFWTYTLLLRNAGEIDKNVLLEQLNARGVQSSMMHVPNHPYTCFKKHHRELSGVDEFYHREFCIPVGWWLNDKDVEKIASIVESTCEDVASNV